ncbi:hypothetical protein B4064_2131 [Caldibacillus thermoamylovorans]|nr:hypothetical protein B4064_2131 [Caldibacillus thermoamylovorans]
MKEKLFEITSEPIKVDQLIKKVESRNAGAMTTFIGTVREWTKGKRTLYWSIKHTSRWQKKC